MLTDNMEPAQQRQDSFSNPQQSSMLSQMEAMLSTKFNCFRQELQESQRDYSEAQLSKIAAMSADSHKFKRKGNEEQYKINSKITFKLKEGQSALQENPTANGFTQRASEKIAEGIELLAHREKLIKLAGSSETGWKVVDEYETNALASDSEEEKRIIRAENRAQRKARTRRAFRGRRAHPYGAPRQHTFEQRDTPVMKPTPSTQRPGLCFGCVKPGHWRAECFKLQTTQGQDNKISKSTICEVNVVHELAHACPLDSTGKHVIHKNKALSYIRARECIVKRLKEVAVDQNLGLHSLRTGGASEAANKGVNERCWKRHGRWKGDISKDGYIADSLSHRLQVTQQLGL